MRKVNIAHRAEIDSVDEKADGRQKEGKRNSRELERSISETNADQRRTTLAVRG